LEAKFASSGNLIWNSDAQHRFTEGSDSLLAFSFFLKILQKKNFIKHQIHNHAAASYSKGNFSFQYSKGVFGTLKAHLCQNNMKIYNLENETLLLSNSKEAEC